VTEADAAVAIVHARAAESVLLMRRAERDDDPWSGHWSFPGGRRDAGDGDLLDTARRELAEECAIRLTRDQLETALPTAVARRRVGRYLRVTPFVFTVDRELPAVPDLREAVECLWVPLRVLRDPARHALRNIPGVPDDMLFPSIDLPGVPLWGFTYRLITEWLGLLPPDRTAATFEAARTLLDIAAAGGGTRSAEWRNRDGARIAVIRGPIPVEAVRAHASIPAAAIPPVNMLQIQPHSIRIVGLELEEYLIESE